jgi:hypothetical protein
MLLKAPYGVATNGFLQNTNEMLICKKWSGEQPRGGARMIDQAARKQTADAIRSYLNEEIKSFQLSDMLHDIRTQTADSTVDLIVDVLWCHYDDDLLSHKVYASKEEWDYFHRLLVVLESDTELEIIEARKWSLRQPIAACAVAAYVILASYLGWGLRLLVLSIAFAPISILLSCWRSRERARHDPIELALAPFSSLSQILAARRRIPFFSKKRYPGHLMKRMIVHDILVSPVHLPQMLCRGIVWLVFSPIWLVHQAMPETNSELRVKTPLQLEEQKS